MSRLLCPIRATCNMRPKHNLLPHSRHQRPHFPLLPNNTSSYRICRPMAAQGGDKQSPTEEEDPRRKEFNLLLNLLVQYPAVRGSVAVAAGYLLHIDPLGTLHWNTHDALVGLSLAALPSVLDMVILLPNWEPKRTTRTMKLHLPRGVAEKLQMRENVKILPLNLPATSDAGAATSAAKESAAAEVSGGDESTSAAQASVTSTAVALEDPPSASAATSGAGSSPAVPAGDDTSPLRDIVVVEREMTVRADQHPLRDALLNIQMSRIMNNLGRALSPPSEALLLTLVHVSEEMLYRGLLLALVVRWCTDNLYYAGMDDVTMLPGGLILAPPQLGALLGGVGLTVAAVGLLIQRELFPLRLLDAAKEQLKEMAEETRQEKARKKLDGDKPATATGADASASDQEESGKDGVKNKKEFVAGLVERLRKGVVVQQRWVVAVEASVEFLQWSTLSAGYLLTGNILTPIVGSMANDVLYSTWQRVKHRKIKKVMDERASTSAERVRRTADLLAAVRAERTGRLEPPKGLGKGLPDRKQEEKESSNDDDNAA